MSELFCDSCELRDVKVTEAAKALEWLAQERSYDGRGEEDRIVMTAAHAAVRCRFNQEVQFCGFTATDESAEELQAQHQARWGALEIVHSADPLLPDEKATIHKPVDHTKFKSLTEVQREREKAAIEIFAGTRMR